MKVQVQENMHSLSVVERQDWEFCCQMNTRGGQSSQQHLHVAADAEVPAGSEASSIIFSS